jgi:hypothetical protein
MTRWYHRLPGPTPLRVAIIVMLAAVAAALLLVGYEWLGRLVLDGGGTMG